MGTKPLRVQGGTVRDRQTVSLAAMLTRSESVRDAGLRGRVT